MRTVKTRQSNIEILRIIAMVMIVLGHFLYQSGGGGRAPGNRAIYPFNTWIRLQNCREFVPNDRNVVHG